jgi:RecB family exonuclease
VSTAAVVAYAFRRFGKGSTAQASPALVETPGEALSPSSLNQYLACSAKYYFRKILRLPDPRTGALSVGSAVHKAIGENLSQKVETRRDLPWEGVQAVYQTAWTDTAKETEFREDEDPDQLRLQGAELARKYLEEKCPSIDPAAVEIQVAGRIAGVRVHGWIDILDVDGRIVDLKTAAAAPSKISPDYRVQVATYVQLTPGASGEARVDTITKTKTPKIVSQAFSLTGADYAATAALYPAVQRGIRAGAFFPNRGSTLCSRRHCAFWRACQKEWGGEVHA